MRQLAQVLAGIALWWFALGDDDPVTLAPIDRFESPAADASTPPRLRAPPGAEAPAPKEGIALEGWTLHLGTPCIARVTLCAGYRSDEPAAATTSGADGFYRFGGLRPRPLGFGLCPRDLPVLRVRSQARSSRFPPSTPDVVGDTVKMVPDSNANRRFYDLTAEATADEWYENEALLPSIREFVSLLPEKPRVLDLGCGPGYESMRLASTGAEVVGIDFSTESIRIARARCPQCRFEVMDFTQMKGRGLDRFDGVFAAASLIHVAPDDLPEVLDGVAEVLPAGGHLLTVVRDGVGVREKEVTVGGQTLTRRVCLYSKELLTSCAGSYRYLQEGFLRADLLEAGWRSYIFCRV